MAGIRASIIKPKPLKAGAMRKNIIAAAQKASIDMAKDMTKITAGGWKDPVEFEGKAIPHRNDIEIYARPKQWRAKNAKIFNIIDKGSGLWGPKGKKYPIRPKKPGGVLSFTSGYKAGSKPNRVTTTASSRSGDKVVVKEVMHPGIEPRNWIKLRHKKWSKKLPQYLEKGMRLAVKESGHAI